MQTTGDVTQLLHELETGDRAGFDVLLARVYDELHTLARAQLRSERAGHTLATTDLIHEAYLRLVDYRKMGWKNRAQLLWRGRARYASGAHRLRPGQVGSEARGAARDAERGGRPGGA